MHDGDDEGMFGGGCATVFAVVFIIALVIVLSYAFVHLLR